MTRRVLQILLPLLVVVVGVSGSIWLVNNKNQVQPIPREKFKPNVETVDLWVISNLSSLLKALLSLTLLLACLQKYRDALFLSHPNSLWAVCLKKVMSWCV